MSRYNSPSNNFIRLAPGDWVRIDRIVHVSAGRKPKVKMESGFTIEASSSRTAKRIVEEIDEKLNNGGNQ